MRSAPERPGSREVGRRLRLLAAALILPLAVAGCVQPMTVSTAPPGSPQAQLASRNAQYNSIVAQGCIGGAVLGGLAGYLIGGNATSAMLGAGAGTAAGCAAGYGIAEQNLSRQEMEDSLNNRIQVAENDVRTYSEDVRLTQRIVRDEKARIATLRTEIASNQASRAQITGKIAQVDNSIAVIQDNLNSRRSTIAELQADIAALQGAGVATAELREKEQRLRELQREQEAALESLIKERRSLA